MPAKLDDLDLQLKSAIGERIKEIRLKTGKNQQNFAHSSGRDKQSFNKNEGGKGATIYIINKFCLEVGISLSEFFDSELFDFIKKKKQKAI